MKVIKGLLCVAMGCMMSCSNILEEEALVATNQKGELSLSLGQDEEIQVSTKAVEEVSDNYLVKITGTEAKELTYADLKNKAISLKVGNYTLTAQNKAESEVKDFEWNAPFYKGELPSISIEANKETTVELTCTRANSTIVVDTTAFGAVQQEKVVYVQSLTAKCEETGTQIDLLKKNEQPASPSDEVCVKAGIKVQIVMIPVRMSDGVALAPITTDLVSGQGATVAKKKYAVKYSLSTGNGGGKFTIKVDNGVESVEVPMEVNPY